MNRLIIAAALLMLSNVNYSQLRKFTYQGDYKFSSKSNFDTAHIFAFPEKWIEPEGRWQLSPGQATISFDKRRFAIVTPKGQIYGAVLGEYERVKIGHKFSVVLQDNNSPYNGTAGHIYFKTDKFNNWTSFMYLFEHYTNGEFLLAPTPVGNKTEPKNQPDSAPVPVGMDKRRMVVKYKNIYTGGFERCIALANEILAADDEASIVKMKKEAVLAQSKSWDAFLFLQDPDLNFPEEKIKAMKKTNAVFWGQNSVFGDQRVLELPAREYKAKVSEQIELINSALPSIKSF